MKSRIVYLLLFFFIALLGCNKNEKEASGPDFDKLKKTEQTYLTNKQIQAYVNNEINIAIDLGNQNVIQEAANVIELTRLSITAILNEKYADAIENNNKAIAKAELIMRSDHPEKLISEVNIEVLDRVENAENARQLIQNVDSLVELGELQKAKSLMTQLTSELRITRESISIASYLQTLRNADRLLKEKRYEQAMLELNSLLSSLSIERSITPLPLIIAKKMITEMELLLNEENPDEESILTLLSNAQYQIRFSEMLGYGKNKNEYQQIYDEVKEIKTGLNKDDISGAKKQVKDMKEKLEKLVSALSGYKILIQ